MAGTEQFWNFSTPIDLDNLIISYIKYSSNLSACTEEAPWCSCFCLQVFDLFDEKKNGVVEFDEFIHGLDVFHPCAPMDEKIDCKRLS